MPIIAALIGAMLMFVAPTSANADDGTSSVQPPTLTVVKYYRPRHKVRGHVSKAKAGQVRVVNNDPNVSIHIVAYRGGFPDSTPYAQVDVPPGATGTMTVKKPNFYYDVYRLDTSPMQLYYFGPFNLTHY